MNKEENIAKEEFNVDSAAAVYDSIKYLPGPAKRTAENAGLKPGQKVLDVACGTGWTTMRVAELVGDTGFVTGIDIADLLLDVARKKTEDSDLNNIEYREGNAESLEFNDQTFDVITCASSIFIFDDKHKALNEWLRVLKPGGTVIFSTYGERTFQPVIGLYNSKLIEWGKEKTSPGPEIDNPQECRELLTDAGFKNVKTITEELGFYFTDKDECWNQLANSLALRTRLSILEPEEMEQFKTEHYKELDTMVTDHGIWIDLPVHFGIGEKPE